MVEEAFRVGRGVRMARVGDPGGCVTGTVRLNSQKVGSPTRFVFAAYPEAEMRPVELIVAFPRGTVFVKRGASCPVAVEPFRGCPKRARLGYGVAEWTLSLGGVEFSVTGC